MKIEYRARYTGISDIEYRRTSEAGGRIEIKDRKKF